MDKIKFKCKACNEYVEMQKNVPNGFSDWAYSVMEWSDFNEKEVPPLSEKHWSRSDNTPKIGEVRIIKVTKPFSEEVGNEFYMEFVPALVYFNGYDCSEQITSSAIVKCRFEKILLADEYSAWISVKVLQSFLLPELSEMYLPWLTDGELEDYAGICKCNEVEFADVSWEIKYWTGQGDIGESKLIYIDEKDIRHLVLMSYYNFHDEISYFGNIVQK